MTTAKRHHASAEVENKVLDELMDGPATIGELAFESDISIETARRVIKNLQLKGLVETWGMVANGAARPVVRYQMARTRKAA